MLACLLDVKITKSCLFVLTDSIFQRFHRIIDMLILMFPCVESDEVPFKNRHPVTPAQGCYFFRLCSQKSP